MLRHCTVCGAAYDDPRLAFCRVDGAPLSVSDADPLLGKVIAGRYRVLEPLGQGGMGSVYVAEHLVMQRPVALKIVRSELADDPTIAKRFVREARIASRLQSPEIVQTLDCGVADDGRLFLAMERLVGGTLRERLEPGPMSPAEAARVASRVISGLRVAHGAGVVHRDLKPDNVFLCEDGSVKVLDFGIAKIFESSVDQGPSLTATSAIVGTALYMSPEAVSRAPVEPPADIYALGAMLFEMLTGEPPFFDNEPVLLMGMHLRVPPPTLASTTGRPWSPRLESLVAGMLEKDPAQRPSLPAIEAELQASATEGFAAAPPPKRSSSMLVVVAALLAVLGLGAAGAAAVVLLPQDTAELTAVPEPPIVGGLEAAAQEPVAAAAAPVAEEPAVVEEEPAPAAPREVQISAEVTPASTVVDLDGERVELPITRAADGERHTLAFSAEGYEDEQRIIVLDSAQQLVIELRARPRPSRRRAPAPTPAPVVRALPPAPPVVSRPLPAPRPVPAPRPPPSGMTSTYGL